MINNPEEDIIQAIQDTMANSYYQYISSISNAILLVGDKATVLINMDDKSLLTKITKRVIKNKELILSKEN
jgi:hypothetical protein